MSHHHSLGSEADEIELLARRALGVAMNSLWGDEAVESLDAVEGQLVNRAQALLRESVSAGPELDAALDLLDRCRRPHLRRVD